MRNKTFISSMVGIAAAVAVAGSANAAIVNGPSLYSNCNTFDPTSSTTVTFDLFNQNSGFGPTGAYYNETWGTDATFYFGMVITGLTTAYPNNANVSSVQYSFDAGATYSAYTLGNVNASDFTGSYGSEVNVGSPNQLSKIRDFRIQVTLASGSNYTLGTGVDGTGGSNVQLRMVLDGSNYGGSAISTGTRAVPAPGALALLGVAGIIGARRRRA